MVTVDRAGERIGHAVIDQGGAANLAKMEVEQCGPRVLTEDGVLGAANRQIAFLERARERERLAEFACVHRQTRGVDC
jgi:hypothetical protein